MSTGNTIALIKSLSKVDPTVIQESVNDWLDDHPEATTTVQDGSITKAKLDQNLQDTVDDVSDLKSAINSILVHTSEGETVTLTNIENTTNFINNSQGLGFQNPTISSGVITFVNDGYTSETSPFEMHAGGWGTKKWICGFKYKLTKLDQSLGDPEMIRIHLGTTAYDNSVVWDEWQSFSKVAELDLTRIRFATRNFSSVPAANSFKIEVKELYLYNATDIDNSMCEYIVAQQQSNYQDGTVTYGETVEGYFPDTSLNIKGKAADSKAVGDAISKVELNVKNYGVKGDGTTNDTDAINDLFETYHGSFYFPSGTYRITGTITLPSESEMYGDGDQTVIDLHSGDNLSAMTFRGGEKVYPYILVNSSDNTKLRDFKLIGNNALQQKRHAGIAVLDSASCLISGLTIYNINYDPNQDLDATVSGYGICVTRSEFVNVERCNVEQCGYECIGIVDDCDFCTVRDCHTKNGWRTCVQVHRGSCNTVVENCYMEQDHTKYDACFTVHGLSSGQEVENLTVNNCVMVCKQNGAQVQDYCAPAQIMGDTKYLCFTNNKVSGGKRAFYISTNHTNAKIIGNDFKCNNTSDYGVTITSYNTIVIGNCLENEASTPVNNIANNPILVGNIGIN